MRPPTQDDIRELMLAVEYMRVVCEQANGRNRTEETRLSRATSVGIRTNSKFKHLCPDYQSKGFWDNVAELPTALQIP